MTATDANTTRRAEVDTAPVGAAGEHPSREPFAMVPEWLLDAAVSDRAIRLYAVLARYGGADGGAYPLRRTLAERLGCSTASIARALRELVDVGAIDRAAWLHRDHRSGEWRQTASRTTVHRTPPDRRRISGDTGGVSAVIRQEVEPREVESLGPVPHNPPGSAPTPRSAGVDGGGVDADADEPPASSPSAPEPPGEPDHEIRRREQRISASEPSGGSAGDRQARQRGAGAAPSAPPEVSADAVALIEAYCDVAALTPAEVLADRGNGKHRPAAASFELLAAAGPVDAEGLWDHVAVAGAGEEEIRDELGWARWRLHEACREPERFVRRPRPAPRDCAADGHARVAELDIAVGRCLDCGADVALDGGGAP